MLLCRDWSAKLNGYFSTDWSHLLLPKKGKSDMLRVDHERYMKYVVTKLSGPNEPVMFTNSILGNYSFNVCATETYFGKFHAETSEGTTINTLLEALPHSPIDKPPCNIVDDKTSLVGSNSVNVTLDSIFLTIYFNGSNCLECAGAGSIIINPQGNQHAMASQLESTCTNDTTEYKGLLQGLKRALDMKVRNLKDFGDSQVIVDQVRERIHYNSPYLERYEHEVWSLINSFDSSNIIHIPRWQNQDADLMTGMVAKPFPDLRLNKNKYYVELMFRPFIPDNISNWEAFKGDKHILELLHCGKTFRNELVIKKEHNKLMSESKNEVISFIGKSIVNKFGIPNALMFNNASYFSSLKLTEFAIGRSIRIRYASRYYPQGTRVAESSNKNFIRVICAFVTDVRA